ncbi:hypothetical protein C1931_02085 [Stenotrophomonas sp. YAU14A_MKIMI4_1]|nr:hypothetical protein C1931_02085 [Stenotrophomonas sp. YAU14A_MKIMI4_1]
MRVVAIDNDEDHLKKIYSALASAGYWVMPIWFDSGVLVPSPEGSVGGIRLIFSDIHLAEGRMHGVATHAEALISLLKRVVGDGPYAIVFWTQYPDDAQEMFAQVVDRVAAAGVSPPTHFGCIDKNLVLNAGDDDRLREQLVDLIAREVKKCGPLMLSVSWEERVFQAAASSTSRIYELATGRHNDQHDKLDSWLALLGYLAKETVGKEAEGLPVKAMDLALLPLLEDRLLNSSLSADHELQDVLRGHLGDRPKAVSASLLNGHYLLEVLGEDSTLGPAARGVVSVVDVSSWDGNFKSEFSSCWTDLVRNDFIFEEKWGELPESLRPVLVTLTPECDDVQGKVLSHRYLFGVIFKSSELKLENYYSKKKGRFNSLAVFDVGVISLASGEDVSDHRLLISCNRFVARSGAQLLGVTPRYRLRRAVVEELAHHYATHARRPGVLRFFGD